MAKIRVLIDTDIIIDSLKGIRAAKELFRTEGVDLYCSILTKKERWFDIRSDRLQR